MLAAKRLIQKAVHHHHHQNAPNGNLAPADLDLQIAVHYGIPTTASLLAVDPIQRLLAVATLDGRIKVIGGDGIEGLLVSPKQVPFKNIEFLENKGLLVSISNENDIEVWNLESRCLAHSLQWESNITAFSVISGSYFMYIGDENGLMSVVKYGAEDGKLVQLPYCISANSLNETAELPSLDHQPIVGIHPQPGSSGNRLLIAYQYGLIILWDLSEARVLFVGGDKDLQLKDETVGSPSEVDANCPNDASSQLEEKEISALCWASSDGSILAVGYIDGDILFWKTPIAPSFSGQQNKLSSSNIVKLQLSSAGRKLPVIVLHWSMSNKRSNKCDGRIFVYGGDEIGAEEVLTVLTLEWSSKLDSLRCVNRLDVSLSGSFADMILLPSVGPTGGSNKADLFVLTSPGQLHLYDDTSLSTLLSQQERKSSVFAMEYPSTVPTIGPLMTVAKFSTLPVHGNSSKVLADLETVRKRNSAPLEGGATKWPLTGGIPSQLSLTQHTGVERLYVAGYQDGSVRLWNATYAVLSLICFLKGEVQGVNIAGINAPVSELDFCYDTLSLAVGNECGLVRIYNLSVGSAETKFCLVTQSKNEVLNLPQGREPECRSVFSLLDSSIRALQFANSGARLAVGFDCGRVVVLDMSSSSVLFFTDCLSGVSSPVISLAWIKYTNTARLAKSPKPSETNNLEKASKPSEDALFVLTKDATLNIIDSGSGDMITSHPWHPKKKLSPFTMYFVEDSTSVGGLTVESPLEESGQDAGARNNSLHETSATGISSHNPEHGSSGIAIKKDRLLDSSIILCTEDSLRLYSTKNVIQGNNKSICKVKHAKPCHWALTLKKDNRVCGVVLLFHGGLIEIRSFPGLELVRESSLMATLSWNFKANMEKTMSSDDGLITLVNGSEWALISLFHWENRFRSPESMPCLHDKVLAAAADAAINFSSNQKKKQGSKPGILGGLVKGFKGGKTDNILDICLTPKSDFTHLEGIFLKPPFSKYSPTVADSQEVVELNIDDIEIDDEPPPTTATTSQDVKKKGTEREQLLGGNADINPRLRTPEEIKATYRKAGDASSVAANARNKLMERQEKLERISRRTAELQNGAEDFASLANELVKAMENRKWWQI